MRKLVAAIVIGTAVSLGAQAQSTYSVVRTFPVGGDGSWDYVVPDRRTTACSSAARIA